MNEFTDYQLEILLKCVEGHIYEHSCGNDDMLNEKYISTKLRTKLGKIVRFYADGSTSHDWYNSIECD